MKTLQNNFTNPEQSERMLELGVPADSADCYLLRTHTRGDTFIVEVLHDELYSKKYKFTNVLEYLPCWSAGRLMEIFDICCAIDGMDWCNVQSLGDMSYIEYIILSYERAIQHKQLDFSKLEE